MLTCKKYWIPFSFILLTICCISYITYSCSDADPCDTYNSFMSPNVSDAKNIDAFYYAPSTQFYDCFVDSTNRSYASREDQNILEWLNYIGQPLNKEDMKQVIYQTSYDELRTLYNHIEKSSPLNFTSLTRKNEMVAWVLKEKDLEALGYLLFAKQCEPYAIASADAWEMAVMPIREMSQKIKQGFQLYKAAKKVEFKRRYAFQMIRTAFYAKSYREVIGIYDSLAKPYTDKSSSISNRSLSYTAGAHYHLGEKAEGAYLFLQLFDQAKDYHLRMSEYISYHWTSDEQIVKEVKRLCKNNHELALVEALQGVKHPEVYHIQSLQKVVELDPNNELVEILLLREVNKIESEYANYLYKVEGGLWLYDTYYHYWGDSLSKETIADWISRKDNARKNLNATADYFLGVAYQSNKVNKALWYSSAAYLYLLNAQYGLCKEVLQKAAECNPTAKIKNQLRIIALLNTVQESKLDAQKESEILPELRWLESIAKGNTMYQNSYLSMLSAILPLKYKATNDTLKMFMCFAKQEEMKNWFLLQENKENNSYLLEWMQANENSFAKHIGTKAGNMVDEYFTNNQLLQLQKKLQQPEGDMEKWMLASNGYSINRLQELKAIKWIRQLNFQEAALALQTCTTTITLPNPFVVHIRDYQDGNYEDTLRMYTLKQFCDTMHVLQQNASKDENAMFHFACGLYAISFHGKCGRAIQYYRRYADDNPYFVYTQRKYTFFEKQYYYAEEASVLFETLSKNAKQASIRQKSLWMKAKCYQYQYPTHLEYDPSTNEPNKDYLSWVTHKNTYLNEFMKRYKGNPFYDSVYNECSYLREAARN
jgi:hypothetical protein